MDNPRSSAASAWVRKRNGQVEVFQKAKVQACLGAVLAASGEGMPRMAAELAEAVERFVQATRRNGPIRTKQLTVLLERVLHETGHPQAAQLLGEVSRRRERRRRQINILAEKPSVGRIVPRRWNKAILVNWLRRRHGLEPAVARMLAGRVERVVLGLDLRRLTSGVVRELMLSEMMAWGLSTDALSVAPSGRVSRRR